MTCIHGIKYENMKASILTVVEYQGGAEEVRGKAQAEGFTQNRMMWDLLWVVVDYNRFCLEKHKFLTKDIEFDMYSDEHNDAHVDTALRKIARELGLTYPKEPTDV